jgi:CRISPR-associated protein Cmr5
MAKSLMQRRASAALQAVESEMNTKSANRFRQYAESLPAAIYMNGLGQAIATELAADDSSHERLADVIGAWLCGDDEVAPYRGAARNETGAGRTLLQSITQHNESTYLRAQQEALEYLTWLKKLARALIEKPSESS